MKVTMFYFYIFWDSKARKYTIVEEVASLSFSVVSDCAILKNMNKFILNMKVWNGLSKPHFRCSLKPCSLATGTLVLPLQHLMHSFWHVIVHSWWWTIQYSTRTEAPQKAAEHRDVLKGRWWELQNAFNQTNRNTWLCVLQLGHNKPLRSTDELICEGCDHLVQPLCYNWHHSNISGKFIHVWTLSCQQHPNHARIFIYALLVGVYFTVIPIWRWMGIVKVPSGGDSAWVWSVNRIGMVVGKDDLFHLPMISLYM